MKNIFWTLLIALVFSQCTHESSGNAESKEGVVNTPGSQGETKVVSDEPGHYKASADAPYIGLWVIAHALGAPQDKIQEVAQEYEGRWFNLKRDNTFESGKWQEKNNTGTWTFDPQTKLIQLDYNNKSETMSPEWRIQGLGDRMVWLGNTPNNPVGVQLKLERETVLPRPK